MIFHKLDYYNRRYWPECTRIYISMGLFANLLFIASYAVIAFAVAVVLPTVAPAIGAANAGVVGLMIFIAGAQLHALYARRVEREETQRQLTQLTEAQNRSEAKLKTLEQDLVELDEILGDDPQAKNSALVAELQVVRDMLESVLDKSGGKKQRSSIKKPVQRARERTAVRTEVQIEPLANIETKKEIPFSKPDAEAREVQPVISHLDDTEIFRITRQALEENRVDLYLQPVVSLPQRKVRYYEAFSRIRDESGGVIVPEQYIALAEQAGLVPALDNLLLFRCVQLVRDFKKHRASVGIFLNISTHTLHDQDFFPQFIDFMSHNQDLAEYLIFEFVEQDAGDYSPDVRRNLDQLASHGFQFSMDKVSSLNLDVPGLAARHFKFVKIDAGILLGALSGGGQNFDAGSLKRMMTRYGVDLIAAKIETETVLVDLLDYDVDYGQGYLFGEPRQGREGARYLG